MVSRERRGRCVQHRLREQGAELWRWLQDGAYIYVCGDAQRMAKDVDDALKAVVAEQGAMSTDQAAAFVAGLAQAGRYGGDVY
jgi:sulfite reductase alpha subunit-like flavoprotein